MNGEDVANILITCGPIPARLDSVKYITNRFKGGLALKTAEALAELGHWVYVCCWEHADIKTELPLIHVKDVLDYYDKVVEKKYEGYVLAAAVANLMPVTPWKGKFPSHLYDENVEFDIKFKIAPRVIDAIKRKYPRSCLVGYKLFDGKKSELISAGKKTLIESKANIIFANSPKDAKDFKWVLTQDGSQFAVSFDEHVALIDKLLKQKWYSTEIIEDNLEHPDISKVIQSYPQDKDEDTGQVFGTFALRLDTGFITTSRYKKEKGIAFVKSVDHIKHVVYSTERATLNTPLLDMIFQRNPHIRIIIHGHKQVSHTLHKEYEFPGTTGDLLNCPVVSNRCYFVTKLEHHGFIAGFLNLDSYLQWIAAFKREQK